MPTAAMTEQLPLDRDGLAARLHRELGQNVYLCYQCLKCSNGCPLSEYFDLQPHQVLRLLQLGDDQAALKHKPRGSAPLVRRAQLAVHRAWTSLH